MKSSKEKESLKKSVYAKTSYVRNKNRAESRISSLHINTILGNSAFLVVKIVFSQKRKKRVFSHDTI